MGLGNPVSDVIVGVVKEFIDVGGESVPVATSREEQAWVDSYLERPQFPLLCVERVGLVR